MDTESIRKSYQPEKIRLLFIGESPPASGKFFYVKSGMTTFTQKAFERALNKSFADTPSFLDFFQSKGCYLDDMTEVPVNAMAKGEREAILMAEVMGLSKRLEEYGPEAVIVVMKRIEPYVRLAIDLAQINCPVHVLLFPGQGQQNKYVEKLSDILREHLIDDISQETQD